jgi:cytochrome c oxidase assembly protein Cox11
MGVLLGLNFLFVSVSAIIGVVFCVIVLSVIVHAVSYARAPVQSAFVKIIDKRTMVTRDHFHDNDNLWPSVSTNYFITVEFQDGARREFCASTKIFGVVVVGDKGQITFKQKYVKDFIRNG